MILIGQGALTRADGAAVLALAARAARATGCVGRADDANWNGFAVLHTAAARVGALDLGLVPGEGGLTARDMVKAGVLDVLFLLGADEIAVAPGAFVVYLGTHGDAGADIADVILPGAAYPEKTGTYVNTEGRVQFAQRASFPPGDAREDWAILRALSQSVGKTLPFDSLQQLRAALHAAHPHMQHLDEAMPADPADILRLAEADGVPSRAPFENAIEDFYLTNPIARASAIMAECSRLAMGRMAQAAE
jgi:NADH-quinone oxidoreductase subunit G